MNKIAAIDIGNTRIKVLSSDNEFITFSYRDLNKDEILEIINPLKNYNNLLISSVNDNIRELFKNEFINSQLIFADDLLKNQTIINYNKIKGIGTDRLFGMIGARTISSECLVTIDCGTANTVNFLNKNGVVEGGYILPGFRTQLDAINQRTNKIFIEPDKLKMYTPNEKIPNNTVDAVLSGIIESASFGIISIIKNNLKIHKTKKIFLTGGYREHFITQLKRYLQNNFDESEQSLKFCLNKYNIELITEPKLVLLGIMNSYK